jgi:hypothetical protein
LPAVVESNRAGDQERLAYGDGSVQKRLPRPDAFQQSALIPQNRVEDSKTTAGREHAFGHNPAHAGDLVAQLGPGEWGQCRGIHISVWQMPKKVTRRPNA